MNVLFVAFGTYPGLKDALKAAVARAGVPVHLVSDKTEESGVISHPLSEFKESLAVREQLLNAKGASGPFHSCGLTRWFVLRELLRRGEISLPVFTPDWDFLIFRNLRDAHSAFRAHDFAVSVLRQREEEESRLRTAPYWINRLEPLEAYCDLVTSMLRVNSPFLPKMNDMCVWLQNAELNNWHVGDTYTIHDGTVFDHHMMTDEGKFESEGDSHRIEWSDGLPYLTTTLGRKRVMANTLHCWGKWKLLTGQLLQAAGI